MGVFDVGGGIMEIREPYEEDEEDEKEKKHTKKQQTGLDSGEDEKGDGTLQSEEDREFGEFWDALGEIDDEETKDDTEETEEKHSNKERGGGSKKISSPADIYNLMTTMGGNGDASSAQLPKSERRNNGSMRKKRVNIIFLDVDGVLVPISTSNIYRANTSKGPRFSEKALTLLARIVTECAPCEIVLSSNWKRTFAHRSRVTEELNKIGIHEGFRDVTSDESPFRQEQIYEWLIDHRDEVRSYVVIDDIDVSRHFRYKKHIKKYCVKTSPGIGLDENDTLKAIRILQTPAEIAVLPRRAEERGGATHAKPVVSKANEADRSEIKQLPAEPIDSPEARAQFVEECRRSYGIIEKKIKARQQPSTGKKKQPQAKSVGGSAKLARKTTHAFTGEIVERFHGSVATAGEREKPFIKGTRGIVAEGGSTSTKQAKSKGPKKKVSRFMSRFMDGDNTP
mmetsp:Transcript_14394/g.23467  ORF Transcript_14394/g.23467 Transcript_14394/m.23467 type:complete len:453 (-) Transcript_14394:296-1654(-)